MPDTAAFRIPSEAEFNAPVPPYTASELWQRIHYLLMAYEGDVTPEQVRAVFGVTLKRHDYTPSEGGGFYYTLERKSSWYKSIDITYDPKHGQSKFYLEWKPGIFGYDDDSLTKQCIMSDLKSSKWVLISELDWNGAQRDTYRYKDYNIFVDMKGTTVYRIALGTITRP